MQENNNLRDSKSLVKSLMIVVVIMAFSAIILIPLPDMVLDISLESLLAICCLLAVIKISIPKLSNLSIFSTMIFIVVLFKLALNIAVTRQILSRGHEELGVISDTVEFLGQFFVGENIIISVILLCFAVFVNFSIAIKGATTISKSNLHNLTLENQQNIKTMNGINQFIRGDAIAMIVIMIVSIVGEILIGFHHNMEIAQIAQTFMIFTLGNYLFQIMLSIVIIMAITKHDE